MSTHALFEAVLLMRSWALIVYIYVMLSIEPGRSKAYSSGIRWRMIYQRCGLGLSYRQIGEQLNVDPSTVCKTVQLFEETGTVHSIQGYHKSTTKKLTAQDEIATREKRNACVHDLLLKIRGFYTKFRVYYRTVPPQTVYFRCDRKQS